MKKLISFFIIAVLVHTSLFGQGMIIPVPRLPHRPAADADPISVETQDVRIKINEQIAGVEVEQVFVNNSRWEAEGDFLFPIPPGAVISDFVVDADGKELRGEILDRDEARRIYDDIVGRRQDPALLEYVDRSLFRASIYPIPPGGTSKVTIRYNEVLKKDTGMVRYLYTLGTSVHHGRPLQEFVLSIDLISKGKIKNVYSPTHDLAINKKSDHHVDISFEERNFRPEGDLLLYYSLDTGELDMNVLSYREGREDGFFIGLISPGIDLEQDRIADKRVIFVFDTSGSMSGHKLEQAKDALVFCLNNLNEGDRFNIIEFDSSIKPFKDDLVSFSRESLEEAKDFVELLDASGGTNINDALYEALEQIDGGDGINILIFLTDGLPTVGETKTDKILKNVASRNETRSRVFVFGVGYDVNTHFLDRLADDNYGLSEYVRPEEDIEVKVSSFFSKISNPVLTNLELDFGHTRTYDLYPMRMPDIFKGMQVVLLGRYEGSGKETVTLTGELKGSERQFKFDADFVRRSSEHDFIPRLWAAKKIGYLIDQIRLQGKNKELVEEVVRLSKRHGIVTEYTSYLIDSDVELASREQEQEYTARLMDDAFGLQTGEHAVTQSLEAKKLKQSFSLAPATAYRDREGREVEVVNSVKSIGGKTFFMKNGVWQDIGFNPELETVKIKSFSKAYFRLSKRIPDLNKYLSLGRLLTISKGGLNLQFGDEGKSELSQQELDKLAAQWNG